MNHIEETGSNLLPELSKETTLLVREITQRLFTIISGKCEPCNNVDAVPMLSSNRKLNTSIAKSTEKMENLTRSYTDYFDSQFKPRTFVPNGTNLFNGRLVTARSVNDVGRTTTEIPKLTRQGTYELDPSSNESFEARKSPPRPAISPPLSHALSESLGQISIQSDEELFGLADYVVKAHQILDRAVNFIAKNYRTNRSPDPEETPENQAQKMARLMPPPLMNSSFCIGAPRSLGKIQTSVARTTTTTTTTGAAVKPPPIRRAVSAMAGSKVASSTTAGTRRVATPPIKPGPVRTLSSLQAKAQVTKPIISGTAKRKSVTGNNTSGPGGPSAIGDINSLRESNEKYKQQYAEASHREKVLVRRLTSKEQEVQEYVNQIAEIKASQAPSSTTLRSTLLDPAVNILIQKLRQELISTKAKLEDTQNELSAWKFTPDSNTGKRLMAKCRLLYQENEDLGRMISSGRIAKLESELALQKSFGEEVKKSQSELDEFIQDLDEDVEGMQSTIYFLQQELRKAKESVTLLQQENNSLKTSSSENNLTNGLSPHTPPIKKDESEENVHAENMLVKPEDSDRYKGARTPPLPVDNSCQSDRASVDNNDQTEHEIHQTELNDESSSDSAALIIKIENELLSDREDEDEARSIKKKVRTKTNNKSSGKTNGEEVNSRTRGRDRAKRDLSAPNSDEEKHVKKKRKENLLSSMDYNDEEDSLVLTNGEMLQSDPE
ncbi:unnamed protein product [Trichogramma brassicae]|uniref:Pre-mRNA-splicing regulator female-lethal(2)D n=1 Tax=Trichogramma brassicae TaxID=86971 RepID=A0A6H5IWS1_9HYME|nr:unnamed protein product [Trichogramma brassicae]